MADFNRWTGTAYLATDPKLYETRNGKEYCRCRLAVSKGFGDNKETMFVTANFWGKTSEYMMTYGGQGRRVMVEAELTVLDKKEDGGWKTSVFLNVTRFNFIDSKRESDTDKTEEGSMDAYQEAYGTPTAPATPGLSDEEDLPF